jgi:lipopolysaccharide transport system permease protein
MIAYIQKVWYTRFFWWHLVLSDIRARFRRSYLGIIWAILSPLLLATILTLVMSFIFKTQPLSYGPYVFSGLIVWDVVTTSGNSGCDAFVKAESYIKQFKHPLFIYSLRTVLVSVIYMLYALAGLFIWMLFEHPHHIGVSLIWLIPALVMLTYVSLPVAVLCGITNTKFRDFSQLLTLIFQMIYYISPIFISDQTLLASPKLRIMLMCNPVYHLLELFRAPILHGQSPTGLDFLVVFGAGLLLWIWAMIVLSKNESRVIHYL